MICKKVKIEKRQSLIYDNHFPKDEAATRESFYNRLKVYPECFWLLIIEKKIVSMVNGMVTNHPILCDEMYTDSTMHDGNGQW